MSGTRKGAYANVALTLERAVAIVLMLSSGARAQGTAPGEASPADAGPTPAPPTAAPPPAGAAEETAPTEFPGVVQGGVVAAYPPPITRPWSTQRNFAIVATEGSYSGFGLGFRGGGARVGLDASFAFLPILATYSANPETFPDFKLLSSFLANASIYMGLYRPDSRTDLGITFGYKYSTLLRHGVGVAFYLQRELAAHWTLMGFVGPCIFPDAEDQIREKTGWVQGSVSSGLAWHQAGLGLSLAFFP